MRLVFVHGINQENNTPDSIKEEWLTALRKGANLAAPWPLTKISSIDAPFYGKKLFELTQGAAATATAIAQGVEEAPDDFADFAGPALEDMAKKLGATEAEILAESGGTTVEQGLPHKAWVKGVARVIERISPFKGAIALMILKQAHAYITRTHIADAVNAIVQPHLEDDEPAIIVAHSLGALVTYRILRTLAEVGRPCSSDLLVTLGAPLSIDVVRKAFPKPRTRPNNIKRWLNGADPDDFVALRTVLDKNTFGVGIDNISNIDNGDDDPHAISGYLQNGEIAKAIAAAL